MRGPDPTQGILRFDLRPTYGGTQLSPRLQRATMFTVRGNGGRFVEKDLLQLVELVTDAVSQHDEIEKNSPCWKRIGASMKRGADVVYKKWACLKHAANEVSHPKTGQNMPFFKDTAAMKALNMQVKDKFTAPLGAGFTQAVYEGVLVATGMSKDEAAKHGKIALGLSDYMPPGGGVKAVASAVKAVKTSEESGTPTSLLQAKRASKRKASQPNMGDLLNMYADRTEARRARVSVCCTGSPHAAHMQPTCSLVQPLGLMHAQRDIMEDYQRSMGAWRKECARVRSEDAAADRAALLEHMKSAREICQQDPLKVYDDEMDKMQKTWQKHKPKLELPEKPVEPHMPDVPEEAPKLNVPGRGAGSSRGKREQEGFDSDGDGEPLGIHAT
ncbi:hypothetical protein QJQ45_025014, partial [Haematococcus lacustris]